MIEELQVSVIIPCKNSEKFIGRAIESILKQTYQSFEIVVINDGSTDNTGKVIDEIAKKDDRIAHISFEQSVGLCEALNAGIWSSQHDWIARMDGDDISLPTRLERQIGYIRRYPDVKVVGCLPCYIDENDRIIGKMNLETFTPEDFSEKISGGKLIFIPGGASMIHKPTLRKLGGFSKEFEFIEDLEMNMRFALSGHLILNVPEYLYFYRKGGSTNTANAFLMNKKMRWIKERVRCNLKGEPLPTYDEYCKSEMSQPLIDKIRIYQMDYATHFFKRFGASIATKMFWRALPFLFLSVVMKPSYVVSKLKPTWRSALKPERPTDVLNNR